jgi:hypothetical protein
MEEYTSNNTRRFLHAAAVPLALAEVSPFTPAQTAAEGIASLAIAALPTPKKAQTAGAAAGTRADVGLSLDPLAMTVVRADEEEEARSSEETTSACAVYAHGGDAPDEEFWPPHLVRLMRNVRTRCQFPPPSPTRHQGCVRVIHHRWWSFLSHGCDACWPTDPQQYAALSTPRPVGNSFLGAQLKRVCV